MDFVTVKSSSKKAEGMCAVYARVRIKRENKNKKYILGFKIFVSEWERYKSGKYDADSLMESIGITYGVFAYILDEIRAEFEKQFDENTASETINVIKAAALNSPKVEKPKKVYVKRFYFTEFMRDVIDDYKEGRRFAVKTASKLKPSTISSRENVLANIIRYENEHGAKLTLEDITMEFSRDYVKWNIDKGYNPNTMNQHMSIIHEIMAIAYQEKLTKNKSFRTADFVPKPQKVEHIFLTPEQIEEMENFVVSPRPKLIEFIKQKYADDPEMIHKHIKHCNLKEVALMDKAKDIFLVGCYTGQRVSDFTRINRQMLTDLEDIPFISLVQKKTGKKVLIPCDVKVKNILHKYRGKLPKISDNVINYHIKKIAELMGWTFPVNIDKTYHGHKRGKRFCDHISTHTARRSFATNAYNAGVPLQSILAITGHSREDKLRAYLKLQAKDMGLMAARDLDRLMDLE